MEWGTRRVPAWRGQAANKQRHVYKAIRSLKEPAKHDTFLCCKGNTFSVAENGIPAWIEPKIKAKRDGRRQGSGKGEAIIHVIHTPATPFVEIRLLSSQGDAR